MRRFVLIAILVLTVLLITTTGIGWYLLNDEAFLKSKASYFVLKYTGRELTIDGPLQLRVGRETTLEAGQVLLGEVQELNGQREEVQRQEG